MSFIRPAIGIGMGNMFMRSALHVSEDVAARPSIIHVVPMIRPIAPLMQGGKIRH
ncbi:MAG: hypothetical protein ACXVAS_14215 [Vulcanimicrobiaceae bacterium]